MDRLRALSVFKAVADNGSFSSAASALDMSCPAVSRMVQDLESLLAVRLIHRTTRRLALTTAGEDVLQRVCGLLESYDELASIGQRTASEPSGVIRMAAPASVGRHYLGASLATFRARYPGVQVELQLCEGTVAAVSEDVDLALCLAEDLRSTQISRPLTTVEVGIYAAPSYLARRGEPAHPSQLGEHDCLVTRAARSPTTWNLEPNSGGDACSVSISGALHANHVEVLAEAAIHGAGIVMLPAFVAQPAVEQGQLVRILDEWRAAPMSLQLTYNSRRHQPMSVRKLIEHLVETLASPVRPSRPSPAWRPGSDDSHLDAVPPHSNRVAA
jgi:DNA-binding transcriptional LysR family regulator